MNIDRSHPTELGALCSGQMAALQEASDGLLLLPTGATEQHGAHLPLNTDTIIGERLCWAVSQQTGIPVLPAQPYTVSSGHTAKWPGTFSLSHETFTALICEVVDWAVATGWKRLLLVNSHLGNASSLGVAVEKARLKHLGVFQLGVVHTFTLTDQIWKKFSEDGEDLHANRAETELMLHLASHLVRMDEAQDDPDRTARHVLSYPVAQTSKNGVTGAPSTARVEQGALLFEQMVQALTEKVEQARTESPPLEPPFWQTVPCPI